MTYFTLVGSGTDQERRPGVSLFATDAATGALRALGVRSDIVNGIYMAVSRDGTRVYCCRALPGLPPGKNGGITFYRLEGGNLERVADLATGRTTPCHVSLSPDEKTVVWAEYTGATAGFADLAADGSFATDPVQVEHFGDGPNKPRQDKAHAHCAIVTPDSKYLMVVDLGLDRVVAYDFANRAKGLKEVPAASIDTLPKGAGPRHIIFSRDARFAYVIFELENYVGVYAYDGTKFTPLEIHSLVPKGNNDFSKAAAIKISEDGSQLFCSNRGHNSIAVFNVDRQSGRLSLLNIAPLNGAFPRDFEFLPGGRFCLVGHKKSDSIATYAYDPATGAFTETCRVENVNRPLFFKFVPGQL